MELNGKRVLVVGLGKSGVASALFLKEHGARVTISDAKPFDQFARELVTAEGPVNEVGPTNFYRVVTKPGEMAGAVSGPRRLVSAFHSPVATGIW